MNSSGLEPRARNSGLASPGSLLACGRLRAGWATVTVMPGLFRRATGPKRILTEEEEASLASDEGKAWLRDYFRTPEGSREFARATWQDVCSRQPSFARAVVGDTRLYSRMAWMQPVQFDSWPGFVREALHLAWTTDAYMAQVLYRLRVEAAVRGVPILPRLLHRLCMMLAQVNIGDEVVMEPGVHILHGQVVMDGIVTVGAGATIGPWVTFGRYGSALEGPTLMKDVVVGTGAKILGPVTVGEGARIAANSVVLSDVPANATVAGAPAKVVRQRERPEGD